MSTTRPPTTGELEHQLYEATIAMLIRCGSRVSTAWSDRLQSSFQKYEDVTKARQMKGIPVRKAFFAELATLGRTFPHDTSDLQQHAAVQGLLEDVKSGLEATYVAWGNTKRFPDLELDSWTCFLDRIAKLNVVVAMEGDEDVDNLDRVIGLARQYVDTLAERHDVGAGYHTCSLSQRSPNREKRMDLVPEWTEGGEEKIQRFSKALEKLWSAKN